MELVCLGVTAIAYIPVSEECIFPMYKYKFKNTCIVILVKLPSYEPKHTIIKHLCDAGPIFLGFKELCWPTYKTTQHRRTSQRNFCCWIQPVCPVVKMQISGSRMAIPFRTSHESSTNGGGAYLSLLYICFEVYVVHFILNYFRYASFYGNLCKRFDPNPTACFISISQGLRFCWSCLIVIWKIRTSK